MKYVYLVLFFDRKFRKESIIRIKAKSKLKAELKFKKKFPNKDFIAVLE